MVGNPFFQNGQLIIVDPRGFIPLTADAGQLGIGGAYRLISTEMKWTPQGYETTITGVFESAYRIPFGKGGKGIKKIFKGSKKKLLIIKNGNHSLSSHKHLKKIVKELDKIILNVV